MNYSWIQRRLTVQALYIDAGPLLFCHFLFSLQSNIIGPEKYLFYHDPSNRLQCKAINSPPELETEIWINLPLMLLSTHTGNHI